MSFKDKYYFLKISKTNYEQKYLSEYSFLLAFITDKSNASLSLYGLSKYSLKSKLNSVYGYLT